MRRVHRFTRALVVAILIAVGMALTTAPVEAARKTPDGVCTYLLAIINYEHVSPTIKAWAIALYNYYECKPTL